MNSAHLFVNDTIVLLDVSELPSEREERGEESTQQTEEDKPKLIDVPKNPTCWDLYTPLTPKPN